MKNNPILLMSFMMLICFCQTGYSHETNKKTSLDPNAVIKMKIIPKHNSFLQGETVWFTLIIKNISSKTVTMPKPVIINGYSIFFFDVQNENGQIISHAKMSINMSNTDEIIIKPQGQYEMDIDLSDSWYPDIRKPGRYTVAAVYTDKICLDRVSCQKNKINSPSVKIDIKSHDVEKVITKDLKAEMKSTLGEHEFDIVVVNIDGERYLCAKNYLISKRAGKEFSRMIRLTPMDEDYKVYGFNGMWNIGVVISVDGKNGLLINFNDKNNEIVKQEVKLQGKPVKLGLNKNGLFEITGVAEENKQEPVYDGKTLSEWITQLRDKDKRMRFSAALALDKIKDKTAVPALIKAMNDKDFMVRMIAAGALGGIGDKSVVPVLIKKLADKDWRVRMHVIYALAAIGDKSAIPHIVKMIRLNQKQLGSCIASALGDFGDKSTVPALIKLLKCKNKETIKNVIISLGKIGDSSVVPIIAKFMPAEPGTHRKDAIRALLKINDKSTIPYLIEVFKPYEVKGEKVRDNAESIDIKKILMQLLVWEVSDDVRDRLKVLTGQNFGKDYAAWRSWWDANKARVLKEEAEKAAKQAK